MYRCQTLVILRSPIFILLISNSSCWRVYILEYCSWNIDIHLDIVPHGFHAISWRNNRWRCRCLICLGFICLQVTMTWYVRMKRLRVPNWRKQLITLLDSSALGWFYRIYLPALATLPDDWFFLSSIDEMSTLLKALPLAGNHWSLCSLEFRSRRKRTSIFSVGNEERAHSQ